MSILQQRKRRVFYSQKLVGCIQPRVTAASRVAVRHGAFDNDNRQRHFGNAATLLGLQSIAANCWLALAREAVTGKALSYVAPQGVIRIRVRLVVPMKG